MKRIVTLLLAVIWINSSFANNDSSIYTQRPHDPEAFYFTPE